MGRVLQALIQWLFVTQDFDHLVFFKAVDAHLLHVSYVPELFNTSRISS